MAQQPSLLGRFVKLTADFAAGATAAGILIVVVVQIVSRLIGQPVSWSEEATRFLFVWMVFLGLAAGFRTVESARVVVFIAAVAKPVPAIGGANLCGLIRSVLRHHGVDWP